ncbi:MAG TPA: nucleoside triphosphate pyrophosphohydrolase [Candidatus Fournierella merdigallinarum]|nr:nucleoside triphosphate pyrophosphohydrolase [Candidatus Fournierella merdigallinarum]
MVDFERKQRYTAQDLVRIVALLRDPENGCPWDKEQTHQSIRANFIEETYEALEAIDLADAHLLEEELGDVLLQVALHCQMEAEKGVFDFDAVCDGICKKLIYRHPHVFGDTVADTTGQVLANWEALKNAEKERTTAKSRLESVPAAFPALMRAAKVQKRAGAYGFAYPDAAAALADLESELAELKEAMASGGDVQWELGDLLFAAVNLGRMLGQDSEQALSAATGRFQNRVIACEEQALAEGKALEAVDAQTLDRYWKAAKQTEQTSKG